MLSREGMATTYTSPRHQRALKRITVNMGRHQEMLERLNEQADRIKGVRERSPFADDTPPADATRPTSCSSMHGALSRRRLGPFRPTLTYWPGCSP